MLNCNKMVVVMRLGLVMIIRKVKRKDTKVKRKDTKVRRNIRVRVKRRRKNIIVHLNWNLIVISLKI
jgi:hypothetical protein